MKSNNKSGQAAMEFLMTYGWAILIVLAAISALAYFGVLSPSKFFPETCTMPPTSGLGCIDFKVTPTNAFLLIQNGGGRDLQIYNMTVGDCEADYNISMPDSTQVLFNLTGCSFGKVGEKIKPDLLMSYSFSQTGLVKTAQGSIVATIAK